MRIARTKNGKKWHWIKSSHYRHGIDLAVTTYCCGNMVAEKIVDLALQPIHTWIPHRPNVCARTLALINHCVGAIAQKGWLK